nr:Dbf20p: Ser/Thr protein kinase (Swiss Prot. accession number P32328) [Saccharomyces cerevisiae]
MFSRSDREVDDLAGNMSHLGFYDLNIPKPTSPQAQYRPARKSENGRLTPGLPRSYKPCDSDDQDTFKNRISLNHSPKKLPKDFHERASQSKTQRVVNVCQLYFLDYYCDMFDYVISRRQRTKQVLRYLEQQRSVKNVSNKVLNEEWALYLQREHEVLRKRRLKPKHKDFQILTQVGQGGYGQVYLAKKKDSDEICALKILNKKLLFKLNETNHVLTEDPESLYLAMEFVPGGDFRTLLINTRILKSGHARFYISEMFCAVNALHELGYTHRDLKPENFLIDATGHIKLTDFGLAAGTVSNERIESMKIRLEEVKNLEFPAFTERSIEDRRKIYHNMRKTEINYANSMVGSPDYMALEVLEGKKYDFTVDYWSLGCMLFESLVGYTPFSGSSTNETYENLRYWKKTLRRPRTEDRRAAFSDRTWDLITRLIADPINRVRSFEQVRKMSYFAEINFETLRTSSPPFIPQLDDETDAGYFDDFTNEEDMAKYADVFKRQNKLSAMVDDSAVDSKLVGFTFRHRDGKQGSSGILYNGSEHSDPFSTFY